MNKKTSSTLAIGNGFAAVPCCCVRLSIGQKLALFFLAFLAATYVNTHLAARLFDSLGSSSYIVNETGRLRYLSQKIAYLATRENGDERRTVVVQIDTYNRILADIKAHLQGEGRILLESNPQLTDMLAGLTAGWQSYAEAVVALVNRDLDARYRQQAFSHLHDRAEEMLVSANAIVDALAATDAEVRREVHRKLDGALLLESLFLLIVFLLAQYRVSRPLRQLNALCHNFAAGEYSARINFSSCDEGGELSRSFNRTAEITSALIHDLNARTREATLLHRVATTLQENITVAVAIQRVVKLLPEGWQYPEIAVARISHGDIHHQSPDFKETPWRIKAAVDCNDGTPLRVAVAYREARPAAAEGPFLAEERQVLDDVVGMLKSFINRLAAQQTRNRLISILESTTDLIASFDPDGRMFYLNAAGRRLFAIDTPEIGIGIEAIYPSWALTQHRQMALPTAARDGLWTGEVAIRAADGCELAMSQMLIAHHDDAGTLSHYSLIAHDITNRKRIADELIQMATLDSLTGLPNRNLLKDRIDQALMFARRRHRHVPGQRGRPQRLPPLRGGHGHAHAAAPDAGKSTAAGTRTQ